MDLAQHAKFPDVARFDDLDCNSVRFFVLVLVLVLVFIFVLVIIAICVGINLGFSLDSLGRKHSAETTLAELLVYLKVRISKMQSVCLTVARRAVGSSACPHLFARKFLQVVEKL